MPDNDIHRNTEKAEQDKSATQKPQQKTRKLPLAAKALIIEGTSVIAFLLAIGLAYIGVALFMFYLWLLLLFWVVAAPVIGIVLCIVSLCKEPHTKLNTALSMVGLLLPVMIVITVIILFSQRVFVITLM